MSQRFSFRITRWGARLGAAVLIGSWMLSSLSTPAATNAQDHKKAENLTWSNAPVLPRHRSEADWLVDVGWKTRGEVFGPFPTHEYQLGEEERFIPLGGYGSETESYFLRSRTEHAYFWFERGVRVNQADLDAATRFFEEHIWPLNNAVFGEEWSPGIDGDRRLHIIHQAFITPNIMGAFSPDDQCPQFLCPESNQREIIYINLDLAPLNSEEYLTTLAHEHQHLIRHHLDGNEARWLNEAFSQLAEHFNGFDPRYIGGDNVREFLDHPDHDLNGWSFDGWDVARYYGAGYLFAVYLYERFGLDFIQAVAHDDYDGLAAIHHILETAEGLTVDEVFADWILANYFDDPYVAQGQYYYQTLDLPDEIRTTTLDPGYPYTDTIHQYGADYLRLRQAGTYDIGFDGADAVEVMGAEPQSGDWMWWSYNHSDSAARLTGAFDLSQLTSATLIFSAWWDIEDDYDWFQVLVSPDMGRSWEIASGHLANTRGLDAPGAYYSGKSLAWKEERIDLTPYVGGPVLIRFEYLTDTSGNGPGIVLDNIGIPELNYADDVETPYSVWNAEGFMRIPAQVAQHWTVTLVVEDGASPAMIMPLALDDFNTGSATVTIPPGSMLTIVIGAMAPFSTEETDYKLTIRQR